MCDCLLLGAALLIGQLVPCHFETHSGDEVPLQILHELDTILHRRHPETRHQQDFRCCIGFQLVQNRNGIDQ